MKSKMRIITKIFVLFIVPLFFFTSISIGFASEADETQKEFIIVKSKKAWLSNLQGEVEITFENEKPKVYTKDDKLPKLKDKYVIKMLSGTAELFLETMKITLKKDDKVSLELDPTCLVASVQVPEGYPGELVVTVGTEKKQLTAKELFWSPAKVVLYTEEKPKDVSIFEPREPAREEVTPTKPD